MTIQNEVELQASLYAHSSFRKELETNIRADIKTIAVFVEDGSNAEETLKKIKIFAPVDYKDKKIVFVENPSGNHWQVQTKDAGTWDLRKIEVNGNGTCGIISSIVALRELDAIDEAQKNQFIEKNSSGFYKLKQEFEANSQNTLTLEHNKLKDFLAPPNLNPDAELIEKITNLLKSTHPDNWLESSEIKKILEIKSQTKHDVGIFQSRALITKDKDTQFETSSFLLGLLNQELNTTADRPALLTDISLLSLQRIIEDKLEFPQEKKLDFSDIFPIERDPTKARVFYNENSDKINDFFGYFGEFLSSAQDFSTDELKKLLTNVGLVISQIESLKDSEELDHIQIDAIKKNWSDVCDITFGANSNTHKNIIERYKLSIEDKELTDTLKRVNTPSPAPSPPSPSPSSPAISAIPTNLYDDLAQKFDNYKERNTLPSKEVFISACESFERVVDNSLTFGSLKSFADFFFYSLENFHAQKDNETTKSALSLLKKINAKLGSTNIESYLKEEDQDRRRHYQAQANSNDKYEIKAPTDKVPNQDLKKFSSAILNQGDDYIKSLINSLKPHFQKEETFSMKMKNLSTRLNDDPVLKSYSSSFSDPDLPLIPDFLKPIPDKSFQGWGKTIKVITTNDSEGFSLILDGKEIKEILYNGSNKLEEFKNLPREELVMEITNFFRTAQSDIIINYTAPNQDSETLSSAQKKPISFDKASNKISTATTTTNPDEELFNSFKEKLESLSLEGTGAGTKTGAVVISTTPPTLLPSSPGSSGSPGPSPSPSSPSPSPSPAPAHAVSPAPGHVGSHGSP